MRYNKDYKLSIYAELILFLAVLIVILGFSFFVGYIVSNGFEVLILKIFNLKIDIYLKHLINFLTSGICLFLIIGLPIIYDEIDFEVED